MALEMWDTAELIQLQQDRRQAPPDGFWMRYFPRVITSTAKEIFFDQLPVRDRRLAPFVAPNVQGRIMRSKGRPMASFAPAYLKPKHEVDPSRAIPRMPGEPFQGNLTLQERINRIVAANMRDEAEAIKRTWDWMGCQAICNGYVDVTGDDYPTQRVDFQRDPSLTITLGAGARWNENTADVMADINLGRTRAYDLGQASVNDMIFGLDAWANFSVKPEIRALLNTQNRGSNSLFNSTGLASGEPYEYQGRIQGPNGGGFIDMWTYNNLYEDMNGVMQPFLDRRDVVGVGGNVQGIQAFGAILDHDAELQPLQMFPKMWRNPDPSVIYTMTQSAPLMVPGFTNNTFRIRTLA